MIRTETSLRRLKEEKYKRSACFEFCIYVFPPKLADEHLSAFSTESVLCIRFAIPEYLPHPLKADHINAQNKQADFITVARFP